MPEISRSSLATYAVFALVVAVVGWRVLHRQTPAGAAAGPPVATSAARAPGESEAGVRIARPGGDGPIVHVAGAVRRPGVYRLAAGARVRDAVRRAGGARRGGDVNAINLAAKVAAGQQIVVPTRAAGGAASAPGPAADGAGAGAVGPPTAPISLNSATAEQLDT